MAASRHAVVLCLAFLSPGASTGPRTEPRLTMTTYAAAIPRPPRTLTVRQPVRQPDQG